MHNSNAIALLEKLYPGDSQQYIASQLGRTAVAVRTKLCDLGLSKRPRIWSKRELNLLNKLYPSRTAEQIADHLGRPIRATKRKVFKLGLRKRLT